jgi:hypothetical protein
MNNDIILEFLWHLNAISIAKFSMTSKFWTQMCNGKFLLLLFNLINITKIS